MSTNAPRRRLLSVLRPDRPAAGDAPRPARSPLRRRVDRTLLGLAVLNGVLHAWPGLLFAHSITVDGLTLHARSPIPPEAAACAARAARRVAQSELVMPGRSEHVYLCNNPWLFRLFAPTGGGFAVSVPLTDAIFVADADLARDLARSRAPEHNRRVLSAVLAHEVTHGLIRRRVGLLRGLTLPGWIAEGYPDHVAREESFPELAGPRLIAAGQSDPSPSFRYFEYRQMVDYLADVRHLDFDALLARWRDHDTVLAETRSWIRAQGSYGP